MKLTVRIFKVSSSHTDRIYICSTTNKINSKYLKHMMIYKRLHNGRYAYLTSHQVWKYDDTKMELLEEQEYESIKDINKRERYYLFEFLKNKNI
jgi:hypothetical protein